MFGPFRGAWPDDSWKGWCGENPPFQTPTFVLTRYPRDSIVMDGGTVFHFVTSGIQDALDRAKAVAGEKDIQIGGGVATIRQYLQAGLIDKLHFAIARVVLGRGGRCLLALIWPELGFRVTEYALGRLAMHVVLEREESLIRP